MAGKWHDGFRSAVLLPAASIARAMLFRRHAYLNDKADGDATISAPLDTSINYEMVHSPRYTGVDTGQLSSIHVKAFNYSLPLAQGNEIVSFS